MHPYYNWDAFFVLLSVRWVRLIYQMHESLIFCTRLLQPYTFVNLWFILLIKVTLLLIG